MQISSTNAQYSSAPISSASPVQGGAANVLAKQQLSTIKLESALGQAVNLSLTRSQDATVMLGPPPNHAPPKDGPGFDKYVDPIFAKLDGGRPPAATQGPVINRPNPGLDNGEDEYSFGPTTPHIAVCHGGPPLPANRPALGLLDDGDKSPAISRQQIDQMARDTQMLDKLMATLQK